MRAIVVQGSGDRTVSVELILSSRKIGVFTASTGEDGIDLVKRYDHDAVIVDYSLPDMSGLEFVRRLRRIDIQSPILVLSADKSVDCKVRCLSAGADDYMAKPLHHDELVARLSALVRRFRGYAAARISIGAVTIDFSAKRAEVDGRPIALSSREYQILELFALRRGKTLTKQAIYDHIYGEEDVSCGENIKFFIWRLRKKLAAAGGSRCIETAGRNGYTMPATQTA